MAMSARTLGYWPQCMCDVDLRPMARIFLTCYRILLSMLAVAGGLLAPAVVAAESGAEYRLRIMSAAYRLADVAPPVPDAVLAIPALLADKPYAALIHKAALEADIEPALVHAVIAVESGYNPAARSPRGALGLMQVMPDTALRYGIRNPLKSLSANLRAGTLYLKDLMQLFGNRLELVLAAYNAGEQAVLRHGERIPPYRETRRYVPAVLAHYSALREPPAVEPPVPAAATGIDYAPGTRLTSAVLLTDR